MRIILERVVVVVVVVVMCGVVNDVGEEFGKTEPPDVCDGWSQTGRSRAG